MLELERMIIGGIHPTRTERHDTVGLRDAAGHSISRSPTVAVATTGHSARCAGYAWW